LNDLEGLPVAATVQAAAACLLALLLLLGLAALRATSGIVEPLGLEELLLT
jgi:hypothetical protein